MTKPTTRKKTLKSPQEALLESKIRDQLAKKLDLIEQGLRLIQVEKQFQKIEGIRGSVDILAVDRNGYYVIIEVKTADASGREALHETLKYRSLLSHHFGLEQHQIRSFIVSTEWRELHRPFSEFTRHFPHEIRGYELHVNDAEEITRIEEKEPLPPVAPLEIWDEQTLLFFSMDTPPERARKQLPNLLKKHGFEHYLLTWLELQNGVRCKFSHALRISVTCFPEPETEEEWDRRAQEMAAGAEESGEPYRSLEELRFCRVMRGLRKVDAYDEMETCNNAKFAAMQQRWRIILHERHGLYPGGPSSVEDHYTVRAAGVDSGDNPFLYRTVITAKNSSAWKVAARNLSLLTEDVVEWQAASSWFLNEVKRAPNVEVTISIYRSPNLLMDLTRTAKAGNVRKTSIPNLSLSTSDGLHILEGFLIWNRCDFPQDPKTVIESILDDRALEQLWFRASDFEEQILAAHGLRLAAFYGCRRTNTDEFSVSRLRVISREVQQSTASHDLSSFSDFVQINKQYLTRLASYIERHILFLGSDKR